MNFVHTFKSPMSERNRAINFSCVLQAELKKFYRFEPPQVLHYRLDTSDVSFENESVLFRESRLPVCYTSALNFH